jgi:ribosomal protein L34
LQLQLTNPQPAARAGYRLTLTDAQGRRVLQRRLPGRADGRYRLALPSLAAGLYNLRLRSTAGGPSFQRKVMLR